MQTPAEAAYGKPVYHLYVVRSAHRDALRAHLTERGIGTLVHYPHPIYLQDAYRDLGYQPGACPNAERAAATICSLPLHPHVTPEQVDRVASAIREFAPPTTGD